MYVSAYDEQQRSTTPVYEAAVAYAALGWHCIPLEPRTKIAALHWKNGAVNYQEVAPDASELVTWFDQWTVDPDRRGKRSVYTEAPNVAAILGDTTVQLDFDGDGGDGGLDYWARLYPLLLQLPRTRTGSGKYHVFFTVASPVQPHNIDLPEGGVIQVRTGRNIAVLPPSLHPETGEAYVWEVPIPDTGIPLVDPETVGVKNRPRLQVVGSEYKEGNPLTQEEIDAIVETIKPHWKKDNDRHDLSLGVAGWLASIGAPEEDAYTIVMALGDAERMSEYRRSVRDSYVKRINRQPTLGWSELEGRLSSSQQRVLTTIADAQLPTFTLHAKNKGVPIPWAIDLADFLAIDFPPDAWLVDGLIEDIQLGMIAGEPGAQKSWIALYLALCVALGEPFFGIYHIPERRPVVYIQEENSAKKLNRRISRLLKWMGYTHDDTRGYFTLITNQSFRIDIPDVMQRLCNDVLTPMQPALVIFDPMVEMHWKKENDNDEMSPLMDSLRQIRNHYECVVILVHHVNKATDQTSFIHRIRGASAITGALDFGIGLLKEDQAVDKPTVFWFKVRDDKKPQPFAVELIDQDDGSIRFAYYDGAKPTAFEKYPEADIIDMLLEKGPMVMKKLADEFGAYREYDKNNPVESKFRAKVNTIFLKGLLFKFPRDQYGERYGVVGEHD